MVQAVAVEPRTTCSGSVAPAEVRGSVAPTEVPYDRDETLCAHALFQQPWWLDAVAPGAWDAAVVVRDGETVGRLPFVRKQRFGLTVLSRPPLTPFLGPWINPGTGNGHTELERQHAILGDLIAALPEHDIFSQSFHRDIKDCLQFHCAGFSESTHYTYIIDDLEDQDQIWSGFRKTVRTHIRKAERQVVVRTVDDIGKAVFGEGLTILGDRIFQLTWKDKLLLEYEIDTFEPHAREIAIDGWGLTNDGRRLIASDGSATLHFLDPDTLAELGTMKVRRKVWGLPRSQAMINEMETVGRKIFANIYRSNEVIRIDLETGCVDGVADFSRLHDELDTEQKRQVDSHSNNLLNGIAYSKERGTFFLTGKRWPVIFEVRMDI